jgi:hypothetical protein
MSQMHTGRLGAVLAAITVIACREQPPTFSGAVTAST